MKIVVASKNPVKINAAVAAFQQMFPAVTFLVEGVSAPSNVKDQPMTSAETHLGALNRAENASQMALGDYWVGIEGGLEETDGVMEAFAWIIVKSKSGLVGRGRTGSFFLPPAVAELIRQGKELGEADDIVFGMSNSKQANGAVGILTGDVLTRTSFYVGAAVLALIPFKNEHLYREVTEKENAGTM